MEFASAQDRVERLLDGHPKALRAAKFLKRRGSAVAQALTATSLQQTMTRQERRLRRQLGIDVNMERTLLDSKSFWLLWNVTHNVVTPASGAGWVVIDAGASNGWYSKVLRKFIPQADFKLLEPLSEYDEVLRSLASADQHVEFVPAALGSYSGSGSINCCRGFDGLSSMFDRNLNYEYFAGAFDISGVERRTIDVMKLDDYLAESRISDEKGKVFLKLDCQGAEFEILKGAERSLSESIAVVHAELQLIDKYETGSSYTDVLNLMERHGFVIFDINPTYKESGGMPDLYGFQGQLTEAEFVFVRSDLAPVRV